MGVRASVQSTKTRAAPCATPPRVSPTSFVPRSIKTAEPSALKVSVAVMQVVIPGRVESIAVSRVQSMKAPLGNKSLCVGKICARTAGVRLGFNSSERAALPRTGRSCSRPRTRQGNLESALALSGGSPVRYRCRFCERTPVPSSRRSKAISAGT